MKTNTTSIPILLCLLFIGGLDTSRAQVLDISGGGAPTIVGGLNGSVTGNPSVQGDLVVTINFGEVSPSNFANIVKVIVPIAVRSQIPYRVQAVVSGMTNANMQALQRADIGFGVANMRAMGAQSRICSKSSHIFYTPFNNDPALNVTISPSGRAAYSSSVNNLANAATILSGPRLKDKNGPNRGTNDGYIFDAIFSITPQFYAPGSSSAVITFTISAGPNVPC